MKNGDRLQQKRSPSRRVTDAASRAAEYQKLELEPTATTAVVAVWVVVAPAVAAFAPVVAVAVGVAP